MTQLTRIFVVAAGLAALSLFDVASLGLVPEAEAVAGVRRRTARRTAVVVGGAASAEVAAANAQTAAAQQEAAQADAAAAAAQQQAAAAQQQAAAPASTPMVASLPDGCVSKGDVFRCGNVYYKPYLQGTTVVYAQVPGP